MAAPLLVSWLIVMGQMGCENNSRDWLERCRSKDRNPSQPCDRSPSRSTVYEGCSTVDFLAEIMLAEIQCVPWEEDYLNWEGECVGLISAKGSWNGPYWKGYGLKIRARPDVTGPVPARTWLLISGPGGPILLPPWAPFPWLSASRRSGGRCWLDLLSIEVKIFISWKRRKAKMALAPLTLRRPPLRLVPSSSPSLSSAPLCAAGFLLKERGSAPCVLVCCSSPPPSPVRKRPDVVVTRERGKNGKLINALVSALSFICASSSWSSNSSFRVISLFLVFDCPDEFYLLVGLFFSSYRTPIRFFSVSTLLLQRFPSSFTR